jgi:DNA-nicking Smr family endonuclease
VRAWLVQKEEVIAFCQARPHDGGAGAVVVLLQPGSQLRHGQP